MSVASLNSSGGNKAEAVSGFCYGLFVFYLVDFFLHFSVRIPAYGMLRPTLLLVALITLLLFLQRKKLSRRPKNAISSNIWLLLGYILLSLPFVTYPGSVIKQNLPDLVNAVVFFFFTAFIVDTSKRLKIFLVVFIVCQVIRVLEPLFLNVTQGYWGSSTHLGDGEFAERLSGAPSDVINPNELGFVIVTIIPFLHYLLLPLGVKGKLLYVGLMPAILYALLLTMSRGAVVALMVVAWMVFKESNHKFLLIMIGVVGIVVAFSVMTPTQKDRYLSLVNSDTSNSATVQGRFDGMISEFELGFRRPIFGHGVGTTAEAKYNHTGHEQPSHNLYAELVIEVGLIGAFIFLKFLSKLYQQLKAVSTQAKAHQYFSGSLGERINKVLTTIFFMYLVYSINYWGLTQYYWYLFGGLVLAYGRLMENTEQSKGLVPAKDMDIKRSSPC